jgi:hypothetical protein
MTKELTQAQLDKHIWEGWTVQEFIDDLEIMFDYAKSALKTKEQVKKWCMENQPYYKKHIPEVVQYFCNKLNL